MKRLIASNTGRSSSLNTDSFMSAILNYHNTPDRDTGLSPAQILYAQVLKDSLPCDPAKLKLRTEWIITSEAREKALSRRHLARHTDLASHSHPLKPLKLNDIVQVQNQRGNNPNKWELSGTVVQFLDYDAYLIKLDGSGRISKRNRRFLRPILPYNEQLAPKPNQTSANNSNNTGSTAESREATTFQPNTQPSTTQQVVAVDKSGCSQAIAPDTLPQSRAMSDDDFNAGLTKAVQNVCTIPHQNKGTRPEAGPGRALPCPQDLSPPIRPTRVKIPTKRYIQDM